MKFKLYKRTEDDGLWFIQKKIPLITGFGYMGEYELGFDLYKYHPTGNGLDAIDLSDCLEISEILEFIND